MPFFDAVAVESASPPRSSMTQLGSSTVLVLQCTGWRLQLIFPNSCSKSASMSPQGGSRLAGSMPPPHRTFQPALKRTLRLADFLRLPLPTLPPTGAGTGPLEEIRFEWREIQSGQWDEWSAASENSGLSERSESSSCCRSTSSLMAWGRRARGR